MCVVVVMFIQATSDCVCHVIVNNKACVCVLKVLMLSSVADLHSYIERSQLTQELGGSQYYCHKTWISHRTVRTNTHLKVALCIFYLCCFMDGYDSTYSDT